MNRKKEQRWQNRQVPDDRKNNEGGTGLDLSASVTRTALDLLAHLCAGIPAACRQSDCKFAVDYTPAVNPTTVYFCQRASAARLR